MRRSSTPQWQQPMSSLRRWQRRGRSLLRRWLSSRLPVRRWRRHHLSWPWRWSPLISLRPVLAGTSACNGQQQPPAPPPAAVGPAAAARRHTAPRPLDTARRHLSPASAAQCPAAAPRPAAVPHPAAAPSGPAAAPRRPAALHNVGSAIQATLADTAVPWICRPSGRPATCRTLSSCKKRSTLQLQIYVFPRECIVGPFATSSARL